MKKLLSILLALVLATGLFAACSGSGSGSQAAGSTGLRQRRGRRAGREKDRPAALAAPVRGGRRRRAGQGVLDGNAGALGRGKQRGPHHRDHALGQLRGKIPDGFSSGEGPDVGYMYLEMFNDFIEMGALEPLDAYITDADRENYLYLDKGFIKGKQYTMPFIVGQRAHPVFQYGHSGAGGRDGAARHPGRTWWTLP